MTRQEFRKIVSLAVSEPFVPMSIGDERMSQISGCALDKKRRFVSREVVASMIVHHCLTFGGTWDFAELENIEQYSKRFDLVN